MLRFLCFALVLVAFTGCKSTPSVPPDPLAEAEKTMADFYIAYELEAVPPEEVLEALGYLYQARAQGKDSKKINDGVAHCLKILGAQEKVGGVKESR